MYLTYWRYICSERKLDEIAAHVLHESVSLYDGCRVTCNAKSIFSAIELYTHQYLIGPIWIKFCYEKVVIKFHQFVDHTQATPIEFTMNEHTNHSSENGHDCQ